MNYTKFCQYEAPIGFLTRMEIEKPYLVFEDLTSKRSCEGFQKELSIFQRIIYMEDEWRLYDPANIYIFYKDMVRLIEASYLIYKYSPSLASPRSIKHPGLSNSPLVNTVNSVFPALRDKRPDLDQGNQDALPLTFLQEFYDSHHLGYIKIDLYNYLQIGLNASYMKKCKYEYFGLVDYNVMFQFRDLSELIAEAYVMHAKGSSCFPHLEGCAERSFAIDRGHTSLLSYECIAKPLDVLDDICDYCLSADGIYAGLKAWKKMLYETDIWKAAASPGNLLYLHENIIRLIDVLWLLKKKGQLDKLKKEPRMLIQNFFEHKKMYEWKALLTEWLEYSLSNTNKYMESQKRETTRSFKQLHKFFEAIHLINPA